MVTVMQNQIQIFQYSGSPITFHKGNSVMVNATEMAKPFGKRCNDFLSAKSTNQLINSLSAKTGISATSLVVVNQGGTTQGTWMHEDLALVFAQWLSPEFYLWCNDRVKELLTTGVATVRNDDEAIAYAMDVLNKRLSASTQRVQMLEGENANLQEQNRILAPKAQYTDEVLQSDSTYTLTQVAHDLGMRSVHSLISELTRMRILFKQSGQYQPTAKVAQKGYFKTRTAKYIKPDGSIGTSLSTVVTERGRVYLHSVFSK